MCFNVPRLYNAQSTLVALTGARIRVRSATANQRVLLLALCHASANRECWMPYGILCIDPVACYGRIKVYFSLFIAVRHSTLIVSKLPDKKKMFGRSFSFQYSTSYFYLGTQLTPHLPGQLQLQLLSASQALFGIFFHSYPRSSVADVLLLCYYSGICFFLLLHHPCNSRHLLVRDTHAMYMGSPFTAVHRWSLVFQGELTLYAEALIHSRPQHAYNTRKTTHIQLYIGNTFAKKIALITATYKIREHQMRVIVAVIRAVYETGCI